MAGRILAGRYELIEKIGEGGMAVVFKSRDRLLNRLVAIKILRPEFTKDAVFVESFRKESQIAASLSHPNIVNVYDVGREANINYIVMELVDGEPLSDIIKENGALDPRFAASIARQVASALSTAHKNNLIHRDVKPHNIMITTDGVAKITDFGIAQAVTEDTLTAKATKTVMGSVHYFSPEQARGGYVDEKSDIYSLGIVMYEMLTGKVPYDGETAVEVAVKHINEEMVPPSKLNSNIPVDLENIVLKATQKVQTDRYKTADEMITDINFVKFSKRVPTPEEIVEEREEKNRDPHRFIFGRKPESADVEEPATVTPSSEPSEEDIAEEETIVEATRRKKQEHGANAVKSYKIPRSVQRIIAIILAIVLALILGKLFFNGKDIDKPEKNPDSKLPIGPSKVETIELENYVGKQYEDVKEELNALGFEVEIDMELPSSTAEVGEILSQNPEAGTEIKTGYTVKFNVSKGVVDGTAPYLIGKSLSSAKHMIESYGYKVGSVTQAYSNDIPANFVLSQNPKDGTTLEAGATINLVMSLGPELSDDNSLNLAGMLYEDAEAAIKTKGFSVGVVKYEFNEEIPVDCIISHDPGVGIPIAAGKSVNLVVSKGPEEINPIPEGGSGTVSMLIDYYGAEGDFELTVYVKDDTSSETRTVIDHASRNAMQGSETITVSGTGLGTVVVMFNNELKYQYTVDFAAGTYY